jgi:Family of unknown function (DUF6415)
VTISEEPLATTEDIRATIDEAEAIHRGPGDRITMEALADRLRRHIEQLLPAAQAEAAQLWKGSREWFSLRSRLAQIEHESAQDLGTTALSPFMRIAQLTSDCRWLLTRYDRGAQPFCIPCSREMTVLDHRSGQRAECPRCGALWQIAPAFRVLAPGRFQ